MHELDLLQENFGRKGMLVRNLCPVPDNANAETKREIILWVGSFRALKRPEMFVELATRFPDEKFVMVGGRHRSEWGLFDEITERASKVTNLTLTGQVQFDEASAYFRRAKLLVLTSTTEGFPNVMLEAWRVGTPTVSTFDPDGVVARYKLGRHAEDLDGLAEGIRSLIADNNTRVEIGARAIEYVREHHDPKSVAQQVLCAVSRLVRRPLEVHA